MSTQDILLSQKFNNYNYAPGIATYGIDGKTGQAGTDGNNIYFTDCNLLTDTDKDLKILAELIANNYLPVKGSTTQINRSYKNNDLFFDYNGIIYQLTNIDDLIGNKDIGGIYSDYFNIAGKINIADVSNAFTWVGDRMILNTSTYGGYDIATINNPSSASNYINKDAVVNIISDNVNENSNIEMIKLQSIDDVDIEDGKLSVYYKTTENAFYLDSNKPIVINGDVKLNNDNSTNNEYDNFSTILTSNDTVTYFKHICDKLRYNILYDSDVNRYKLVIYQEDGGRDDLEYLINRNETVYGKVYDGENNQVLMKLSNIIDSSINSKNYYDYMGINGIIFASNPNKNSFDFYFRDYDSDFSNLFSYTINAQEIIVNQIENANMLNIDININTNNQSLNKLFNNQLFGVNIYYNIQNITNMRTLVYNVTTHEWTFDEGIPPYFTGIKKQSYSKQNEKNIFKFTFNTNEILSSNKLIYINIYPLTITNNDMTDWGQEYESNYMNAPIKIILKLDNTLNGTYTLYFTLDYSEEKFSIKNIMLFDKDNLDNINEIVEQPCIVSYLPDSVESVQRFSLLHNTEVFINYQE